MEVLAPIAAAVPVVLKKMFGNSDNRLKQAEVEQRHELQKNQELELVRELGRVKELEIVSNENKQHRKHEMKLAKMELTAVGKNRTKESERNFELKKLELEVKEKNGLRGHNEKVSGQKEVENARKDREARKGKKDQNFHVREEKKIKFKFSYLLAKLLLVFFICCLIFMLLSKLKVVEVNTQSETWNEMVNFKGWKPDPDLHRFETESYHKQSDQSVKELTRRKKKTEL